MSIRSLVFTVPLLATVPAGAQSPPGPAEEEASPEEVAERLIERAKEVYSVAEEPPERPADCVEVTDGTLIIVCAPIEEDPAQFRGRSRLEDGDDSHLSWDGAAPSVAGKGIFSGPATVGGLCGFGLNPCPPPPVYYIDVTALPEAPPGSDADRIARGLAPRGSAYDDGEPSPDTQVIAGETPPEEEGPQG